MRFATFVFLVFQANLLRADELACKLIYEGVVAVEDLVVRVVEPTASSWYNINSHCPQVIRIKMAPKQSFVFSGVEEVENTTDQIHCMYESASDPEVGVTCQQETSWMYRFNQLWTASSARDCAILNNAHNKPSQNKPPCQTCGDHHGYCWPGQ